MKNVNYDEMSIEELERELRETFFYSDKIDEHLSRELELIREALERKRPTELLHTPEEAWEAFLADNAEELAPFLSPQAEVKAETRGGKKRAARARRVAPLLRRVLIAAVLALLLAGAALAADALGLVAWVPRWNAAAGRYEPAAQEVSVESPIPAALAELGITEPVYPAKLPEGFVITESHISTEPLVLVEQYARGSERLSITVTPIKGFETVVFQQGGKPPREYRSGGTVHYVFETENTVTAIWYTKHYATAISGSITRGEIKEIIASMEEGAAE